MVISLNLSRRCLGYGVVTSVKFSEMQLINVGLLTPRVSFLRVDILLDFVAIEIDNLSVEIAKGAFSVFGRMSRVPFQI